MDLPEHPLLRRGRSILACASVALALSVSACSGDDGSSAPSTDAEDAPTALTGTFPDYSELVGDVSPSVVAIEVSGPQGSGVGSGAIVDGDGLVVTNAHVVDSAEEVQVLLADGTREPAEIVATDTFTDLALVRIERSDLPVIEFSEEAPEVGQPVVSIGSPLGFENTVSAGIISGLQRSIPQGTASGAASLVDLIQTDAAISPGSSGGVLVSVDGRVVGINVAYIPPQSGAVSLGFAIPAATADDVITDLLDDGRASHPYLGVQIADVTGEVSERFDLPAERGVVLVSVEPGGPLDRAGLGPGSLVTGLAGVPVDGSGSFLAELRRHEPGDEIDVTVTAASGQEQTVRVTVGERPVSTGS